MAWWDVVVEGFLATLPILVAVVSALIVYVLNERSKKRASELEKERDRLAFERERKYDRKLEAYTNALNALRDAKEAVQLLAMQFVDDSIFEDMPEKFRDQLRPMMVTFRWYGALMVRLRFGDEGDMRRLLEEFNQLEDTKALEAGAGEAVFTVMKVLSRTDTELTKALGSLALVGASTDIRKSALEVAARLPEAGNEKPDFKEFDERISKVEAMMYEDLEGTISHS